MDATMGYHRDAVVNMTSDTSMEHSARSRADSPASSFDQSPSASAFLQAEKTLQELASQLSVLGATEADVECGDGCAMSAKLALSAEIGTALLQRCEAVERRHAYEMKRHQHQLDVKDTSLLDSTQRVQSLERANTTHLTRYAELNRRHEALEKRYTQSIHDHTLTQRSLSHVRAELASQRTRMQRQSISLAMSVGAGGSGASGGWEDKLAEVEKRLEDVRDEKQAAVLAQRESERRSKRLEARVEELEQQLTAARAELEETREARQGDARALLSNAKERLDSLHKELSETFRANDPEQTPEYQIAMENLVASNTMLKHDASELSHLLAESRDEVRGLRDEVEELRSYATSMGRVSPAMLSHPHLAAEIMSAGWLPSSSSSGAGASRPASATHARTESSPLISSGTFTAADRAQWVQYQQQQHQKRMSVSSSRFGSVTDNSTHARKSSLAPSFASTSTTDGVTSPGLGYGSIGEYSGQLMRDSQERAMSPTMDAVSSGRESPRLGFRSSTSGGIGYVLNGVPKAKRPGVTRSISERPKRASGQWALRGVDTISEQPLSDVADGHTTDEPLSPSSEYFRAADISRKRRSLMLARHSSVSPNGSTDYNVSVGGTTLVEGMSEVASPADMGAMAGLPRIDTGAGPKQSPAKKHNRRTLLLLTKSKGVQTRAQVGTQLAPEAELGSRGELSIELPLSAKIADMPLVAATLNTSAAPGAVSGTMSPHPDDRSETSSLHVPSVAAASGSGHILAVVDHLAKLLNRLRAADIPTLNRRLRKQHLPGDVSHLSRSTLQTLSKEIGELKSHNAHFRPLLDINSVASIQRREWTALLKLLRDVFDELVDMQALINDVTLNPKLAKRLQKDAYRDEEEAGDADGAASGATGGGLGWIANPITRLFVTPAVSTPDDDTAQGGSTQANRIDRTRLKPDAPMGRAAPKQAAVASATTTHVEVGFGGVGVQTRGRVVPTTTTLSSGQEASLSEPPSGLQSRTVSAASGVSMASQAHAGKDSDVTGNTAGSLMPPQPTLRRAKSRANRNELLGIFAGAQAGKGAGTGTDTLRPARQNLRAQSSQYFDKPAVINGDNERTIRVRKAHMSQDVNAVLDPQPSVRNVGGTGMGQHRDGLAEAFGESAVDEVDEPSFQPLLYRTLRPRGNSDSSIRSTFISHAITDGVPSLPTGEAGLAGVGTGAPTARQGGYGYGLLAGLRGKLWATAAPAAAPISVALPATAAPAQTSAEIIEASIASGVDITPASDISSGEAALGTSLAAPSMSRSVSSSGATVSIPPKSKPVSIARSVSSTGSAPISAASPRSHGQSPSQTKNGLLGYIASSLGGEALLDPESDTHRQFGGDRSPGRMGRAEEEDMMRAALRQGSGVPRRHTRWE